MRYTISCALASLLPSLVHAEVPKVVTDIPPVHALVAQVMGNLGQPQLLLAKGADEHDFALKPSQMQGIAEDLIEQSRTNRELMVGLVRTEVERTVGRMGFVREEELAAVRKHVERLERQLNERGDQAADVAKTGVTVAASAVPAAAKATARATDTAVKASKAAAGTARTAARSAKSAAPKKAPAKKATS